VLSRYGLTARFDSAITHQSFFAILQDDVRAISARNYIYNTGTTVVSQEESVSGALALTPLTTFLTISIMRATQQELKKSVNSERQVQLNDSIRSIDEQLSSAADTDFKAWLTAEEMYIKQANGNIFFSTNQKANPITDLVAAVAHNNVPAVIRQARTNFFSTHAVPFLAEITGAQETTQTLTALLTTFDAQSWINDNFWTKISNTSTKTITLNATQRKALELVSKGTAVLGELLFKRTLGVDSISNRMRSILLSRLANVYTRMGISLSNEELSLPSLFGNLVNTDDKALEATLNFGLAIGEIIFSNQPKNDANQLTAAQAATVGEYLHLTTNVWSAAVRNTYDRHADRGGFDLTTHAGKPYAYDVIGDVTLPAALTGTHKVEIIKATEIIGHFLVNEDETIDYSSQNSVDIAHNVRWHPLSYPIFVTNSNPNIHLTVD
jgi:hypothetical protein